MGGETRHGRGVSPVVGVISLVAIVVLLAALLGASVLTVGDELSSPTPQIAFRVDYHPDGNGNGGTPYVLLHHVGGDLESGENVYIVDDADNRIAWADIYMGSPTAGVGTEAHLDGFGSDSALKPICRAGQAYRVVYDDGRGTPKTVQNVVIPTPPRETAWC